MFNQLKEKETIILIIISGIFELILYVWFINDFFKLNALFILFIVWIMIMVSYLEKQIIDNNNRG